MMKDEKKNKNKAFIKEVIVILVLGLLINAFCFFVCSITGHCANLQNAYPYYINETYTASGTYGNVSIVTDDVNSLYNSYFKENEDFIISDIYTRANLSSSDKIIVTVSEVQPWTSSVDITFNIFVNPTCNTSITESTIFSQTPIQLSCTRYRYSYEYSGSNGTVRYYGSIGSSTSNFNILGSANFFAGRENWGNYVQILNYPLFMVGYDSGFLSSNNLPVIAYSGVSIGEFAELPSLDELLNNISNTWEPPSTITGHALPNTPTEQPNNSDFQNRLQMFQYLADTITQNFGNLGYNLKKWFDNIQQKLTDVANSISQNIYNGFKTLMDNIKDFFGPKIDAIIDKINWLFEPFSSEELADNLDNGSFSSDILGLTSSVTTFGESLTSGTEPNSCTFTLDFRNSYYNFGVCEFSLDWILPMRPGIRLVIGCLCVYSLIVSIFTSINTYIGGTSSINDDI